MSNEFDEKVLKRLRKLQETHILTVDNLIEYLEYDKKTMLCDAIRRLRDNGKLTTKSIIVRSRFETQIIVGDETK